jgi:hypothetical protein
LPESSQVELFANLACLADSQLKQYFRSEQPGFAYVIEDWYHITIAKIWSTQLRGTARILDMTDNLEKMRFRLILSQIFKPEMISIPYGHNEHSLLRHLIRPRLHDRPHHHENHARLLGEAGRVCQIGSATKG